MPLIRRVSAPLALTLALASCVPIEEPVLPKNLLQKEQRTLVVVYPSPGPILILEDNKAETAVKIMPGLGILMQSVQNDRALRDAKDLQQYLPAWHPEQALTPLLQKELAGIGYAGTFIAPEDAAISGDDLKRLNQASDQLDWRERYYLPSPEGTLPRDYSKFLTLDNAMVLEVNLLYGLTLIPDDTEGKMSPTLGAKLKFYRADTMRLFWWHEDTVEDKAGAQNPYEFKLHAQTLIDAYGKLLPQLAQKVAASFRQALSGQAPGVSPAAPASPRVPPGMAPPVNQPPATPPQPMAQPGWPPPQMSAASAASSSTAVSPSTTTAH